MSRNIAAATIAIVNYYCVNFDNIVITSVIFLNNRLWDNQKLELLYILD